MTKKHVFGPVPSRRLGFSLGIDLVPLKTCTYNCVYCQLFQTSNHTIERQSFFDKNLIVAEVLDAINENKNIDYLTFSGSGEPTLNSDIGYIIEELKKSTDIPIVLITNSSLLWMPQVREDVKNVDAVMPSIDSVIGKSWNAVNRPASGIDLDTINQGLKDFCNTFKGKIWMEVMLVEGINDNKDEIKKIADFVNSLRVDKVQINTVVRPPNEKYAKPLSKEFLEDIVTFFNHDTEIIAPFKKEGNQSEVKDKGKLILDLLTRRPCILSEMAESLGVHVNEASKLLQKLEEEGKVMRLDSGHYSLFH